MVWDFAEANTFCGHRRELVTAIERGGYGYRDLPGTQYWRMQFSGTPPSQTLSNAKVVFTDLLLRQHRLRGSVRLLYVWLRRSLKPVSSLSPLCRAQGRGIGRGTYPHGGKDKAEAFFSRNDASDAPPFNRASSRLPGDIYYAFKQAEQMVMKNFEHRMGDIFLDAVIRSGLCCKRYVASADGSAGRIIERARNALASSSSLSAPARVGQVRLLRPAETSLQR